MVALEDLRPAPLLPLPDHYTMVNRQRTFGYTHEDLKLLIAPMAVNGEEAIGSMGTDTALAVLSDKPRLLYDYFAQLFAQVTNPPLDAIREELITSMGSTIGPEANLLKPGPEAARQIRVTSAIVNNEELAKLRHIGERGFKAITLPMLFTAAGLLLGVDGLGIVDPSATGQTVEILALATLAVVLFLEASHTDLAALRRGVGLPARLLGIGLPLTIVAGFVVALPVLGALTWAEALVLAIVLAPTDAALGQSVVTMPRLPLRVRQGLNVESGLNDGIATPVVFVALALATAGPGSGSGWLGEALLDLLIGTALGLGIGLAGGWLLLLADGRRWTSSVSRQLHRSATSGATFGVPAPRAMMAPTRSSGP